MSDMEASSHLSKPMTIASRSFPTAQYGHPYILDNRFHTTVMYTPYGYATVPLAATESNFVGFSNATENTGRALMFSPYFNGWYSLCFFPLVNSPNIHLVYTIPQSSANRRDYISQLLPEVKWKRTAILLCSLVTFMIPSLKQKLIACGFIIAQLTN